MRDAVAHGTALVDEALAQARAPLPPVLLALHLPAFRGGGQLAVRGRGCAAPRPRPTPRARALAPPRPRQVGETSTLTTGERLTGMLLLMLAGAFFYRAWGMGGGLAGASGAGGRGSASSPRVHRLHPRRLHPCRPHPSRARG